MNPSALILILILFHQPLARGRLITSFSYTVERTHSIGGGGLVGLYSSNEANGGPGSGE